jgi:hypothetical protein
MADTLPRNEIAATVAVDTDETTAKSSVAGSMYIFEPLTCHYWSNQSCLPQTNTSFDHPSPHCAR